MSSGLILSMPAHHVIAEVTISKGVAQRSRNRLFMEKHSVGNLYCRDAGALYAYH